MTISMNTAISKTSPTLSSNQKFFPSQINNNNNQLPYQENLDLNDKSTPIPRIGPYWRLSEQQEEDDDIIVDDFKKREKLLSNTIDKLTPKYEEIRNLLSHLPEQKKTQILGGLINDALVSDNPLRYINNKLKEIRKAKFYNMMLDDASVFLGFNKHTTKEYLKMRLKEDTMD
jgi:hypothetical protein